MGFLKRFFSLGSRKSSKRKESRPAQSVPSAKTPRSEAQWQRDQEGDVTRLLRSSSSHFNVVKEVDYLTLPPIREFQSDWSISCASVISLEYSTPYQQRNKYASSDTRHISLEYAAPRHIHRQGP